MSHTHLQPCDKVVKVVKVVPPRVFVPQADGMRARDHAVQLEDHLAKMAEENATLRRQIEEAADHHGQTQITLALIGRLGTLLQGSTSVAMAMKAHRTVRHVAFR